MPEEGQAKRGVVGVMQLISEDTLLLALQYCHYADNPHFRLCYNSLGAYGTVNHLHFQVLLTALPPSLSPVPGFQDDALRLIGNTEHH